MIVAQGGAFAGWSLYVKDGRPKYCYNLLRLQRFYVDGDAAIPSGQHQVRMEFAYDGGGLGKGGDRHALRRRREGRRGPRRGDRADGLLGRRDAATSAPTPARRSATTTRSENSRFTGTVEWVQIDIDEAAEDLDHLITPEERLTIAMARQ